MKKIAISPVALATSLALTASLAQAQTAPAPAPVPGQDGLNSAMFWFAITVIAMVLSLYAVHRSVFRKR